MLARTCVSIVNGRTFAGHGDDNRGLSSVFSEFFSEDEEMTRMYDFRPASDRRDCDVLDAPHECVVIFLG